MTGECYRRSGFRPLTRMCTVAFFELPQLAMPHAGFGRLAVTPAFQGTAPDAERLVMRPGVQWERARSPVVWLAV